MSAAEVEVLAELPSRDTLLAQFAGALSAPLQQLAGLVQALPRNLAYGISALLEQRQAEAPTEEATAAAEPEATGRRGPGPPRPRLRTPPPPRPRRPRRTRHPMRRPTPAGGGRRGTGRRVAGATDAPIHPPINDTTRNKEQRRWQEP